MLLKPETNRNSNEANAQRGLFYLRQKIAQLLPPMWYNNDRFTSYNSCP